MEGGGGGVVTLKKTIVYWNEVHKFCVRYIHSENPFKNNPSYAIARVISKRKLPVTIRHFSTL